MVWPRCHSIVFALFLSFSFIFCFYALVCSTAEALTASRLTASLQLFQSATTVVSQQLPVIDSHDKTAVLHKPSAVLSPAAPVVTTAPMSATVAPVALLPATVPPTVAVTPAPTSAGPSFLLPPTQKGLKAYPLSADEVIVTVMTGTTVAGQRVPVLHRVFQSFGIPNAAVIYFNDSPLTKLGFKDMNVIVAPCGDSQTAGLCCKTAYSYKWVLQHRPKAKVCPTKSRLFSSLRSIEISP